MTFHFFRSCAHRAAALLLAIIMVLGLCPNMAASALSSGGSKPSVFMDGEPVTDVILEDGAKLRLEAVPDGRAYSWQWEILDPNCADRWISIADGATPHLWVTCALVYSMLADDNTARLRCRMSTPAGEVFTDPVLVTLSLSVTEPVIQTQPLQQNKLSFYASSNLTAGDQPLKQQDKATFSTSSDDETPSTCFIVINYLFDNNTIAFEPYGASVAMGSDFKASIPSPEVVGYAPFRRVGDSYVDASVVDFDLTNVRSNITVNVIYEPALVDFSVHHHLQNILDDEYSVHYDMITTGKALTGSVVGDGLALTEEQLPGFKALAYEKLTVAADSSTVIEIRYDRNYYLVEFDMDGGYGTEPVYTRYGATVGANTPIRHGYVFGGWELVSYGGQAPTAEQAAQYALSPGGTIPVPAANLRYRAVWITQKTSYTMVFWQENPDDNGYSYWGYLDGLTAMSGSYVDGQDYISRVAGIDDEDCFTFNPNKTDKQVLVEGDGSTVVNVYYTRNYYKLTFKAPGLCTIIPDHTHGDSCYEAVCGLGHVHTADCHPVLECTVPEHTSHDASCVICGQTEHIHGSVGCSCTLTEHSHTVNCWSNIGSVQASLSGAPSNPQNGYIYRRSSRYYIHVNGVWYRYTGRGVSSGDIVDPSCGQTAHTHGTDCSCSQPVHAHTAGCFRDSLHAHGVDCYSYSCGADPHVHDSSCMRLICATPENHTHSSTCTRSTSTNTVKTVYAKYGQSLHDLWPITDDNGKTYSSGERWDPSDSSLYSEVLVYISKMPADDFTLTLNEADYKTYTMNYYLQTLPGIDGDQSHDSKQYDLDLTVVAVYNYITRAEDFFDIKGFVQAASDPAFGSNGQISTNGDALTVNFYYDRITDHYLEFSNNGIALDDNSVYGIPYGASVKSYNFEPPYPDNLEPNAYTFGGWYTSPGCFAGTEVNWDTLTMPEGDLLLYARWVPITHTVRVFKDATLTEQIGADQIVDHKAFAHAPVDHITNGSYVFQGWFYQDEVNGVMVEKAFAFHGIPVVDDMDIYAKWSSHVSVDYRIHYKLFNTDIEIADPTVGSSLAGHNKTFDAKAGDQLYAGYQTSYFPLTNSHTITMSIDGVREFTFYYVHMPSMPYKVEYVNADTGEKLCEDKLVMDNDLSVATETFRRFDKMMPDAYQKRLVLSADTTDADGDGIYDANVITFYYHTDEENAYCRVVHYIENMAGGTYREYRSEETVSPIGSQLTISALTLTGFAFNGSKTTVNGSSAPTEGTTVTATLGADGLLVELYYDRLSYNYVVHYVDNRTGDDLVQPKTGSGTFGSQIVEYALDLQSIGYELVSDNVKTYSISANEEFNVIEFRYQEKPSL